MSGASVAVALAMEDGEAPVRDARIVRASKPPRSIAEKRANRIMDAEL
jgi:hypothetical protein